MLKSTPAKSAASVVSGTTSAQMLILQRKKTEMENKKAEIYFKVFKLNEPPQSFTEKHYLNIKNMCQKLSNGNRSVKMVNDLLKVIFCTSDAKAEEGNPDRQLTCIQMKFHLCGDLAKACKISI